VLVVSTAGFALAASVSITLGPKGPDPAVATVEWGDTLSFVNGDSVTHAITSAHNDVGPATLAPGATVGGTVTAKAGSYQYRQTGGKSYVGTVVVTATGTVTLKASKATIVYGQAVVLSGVSSKPDTPVLIEQRVSGDATWKPVGTVASGADGVFSDTVRPQLSTKLRASIAGGQLRSDVVAVALKPALAISSSARVTKTGHVLPVGARVSPPGAARRVTLLACSPYSHGWHSVGAKAPGPGGRVTFAWKAGYGRTLLRAQIQRSDVAQGFQAQQSGTIAITGIGSPPDRNRPKHAC